MNRGTASLIVRDEELLLHPRRAVLWPRRKTVIVADTHFGKSSFFGHHGIPVPGGSDEDDRNALELMIKDSEADRLIILGDFLHAPMAADSLEARELESWLQRLGSVHVVVIAGNHDRGASRAWTSIEWYDQELLEPPFRFVHEAVDRGALDSAFSVSGHIHPVMRLGLLRRPGLRVPVFWQRAQGLVLPSFGAFTGGYAIRPAHGEHLFAVGPTAVARVS